jgi:hypothetical protein
MVGMILCMFAYSSRRGKPVCTTIVCFGEEITETEATTPKTVLGSGPNEDGFCSSETKHDRRTALRQNLFVSARRLQELRSQTRNLSWVRVPVKKLGLGTIFSYDIQQYVSNDQAYGKLSGNNIGKICQISLQ